MQAHRGHCFCLNPAVPVDYHRAAPIRLYESGRVVEWGWRRRLGPAGGVVVAMSRPGFDGDLEARMLSWQKGILPTPWLDRGSIQRS
jgi:hypothetical protein